MKKIRHRKILDLVSENEIETQEELIAMLRDQGFDVTQATVSRDMRELKLTKGLSENGKYRYTAPSGVMGEQKNIYSNALAASIKSVDYAMNNLIIKTYPGMAQAVAAGIDAQPDKGVLGCVAGDDTIIIVTRDEASAEALCAKIRHIAAR